MNNQLDIYVWSIEDRHEIRVTKATMTLIPACFNDVAVARNFRDWVAGVAGLEALVDEVIASPNGLHKLDMSADARTAYETIINRRQHPAAIFMLGKQIDCIMNHIPPEAQHGTE